jgi:uncharacterized protein (DUF2252 family)
LLDARTELRSGERRFVRGPRYFALPGRLRGAAGHAFAEYVARLSPTDRPHHKGFEIVDMAFRVAGTGSLGAFRVAVLTLGKGLPNGCWIFDMKQQGAPSGAGFGRGTHERGANRVVAGMHACLAEPPRLAANARLGKMSLLVRRLTPQEDKLDLSHLGSGELGEVADYLGALAGRAHRRGAQGRPAVWPAAERRRLVLQALELAGLHEACYLAYCRLAAD